MKAIKNYLSYKAIMIMRRDAHLYMLEGQEGFLKAQKPRGEGLKKIPFSSTILLIMTK